MRGVFFFERFLVSALVESIPQDTEVRLRKRDIFVFSYRHAQAIFGARGFKIFDVIKVL